MAETKQADVSVHCLGTSGSHRWCLVCRHNNGVLSVDQLRQLRDVYRQNSDPESGGPEEQAGLANINEALMLLGAV
jgi:hypothetical protein